MSWLQIFCTGILFASAFLYLIYTSQEKILYLNDSVPPKLTSQNPYGFANPRQQNLYYRDIYITTPDNIKLHCWYIPYDKYESNKYPTIIFYHANAGNMGFRMPNILQMHTKLKVNIFILSYRGYGHSEGTPSEDGIKIDASSVIDYIIHDNKNENLLNIDIKGIFIFGRSLGGAVSIYVAHKYDDLICGLIIENTFTSISDMVGKVFPFLNFEIIKRYMLKLKWESYKLIPNITSPILFYSSTEDEVVPSWQMSKLYSLATSAKFKKFHKLIGGTHNDGWLKGGKLYWIIFKEFMLKSNETLYKELDKENLNKYKKLKFNMDNNIDPKIREMIIGNYNDDISDDDNNYIQPQPLSQSQQFMHNTNENIKKKEEEQQEKDSSSDVSSDSEDYDFFKGKSNNEIEKEKNDLMEETLRKLKDEI